MADSESGRSVGASAIPKDARRVLRRRLLVPGCAVLVGGILIFFSWLGWGIVDRRLIRNQADTNATVVWVHHGLLAHWRAVRVSYQTSDGRTVLATVHTGSADAQGWIPGEAIPISYNQRHPSAVVYWAENGDFDDTREDFWIGVGLVGALTGLVALAVLAVRWWGGRRYKRRFTDADDAMPATFLSRTRKHLVTTVELETPGQWGPKGLSVRLLGGQDADAFAPGEELGVYGRTGAVVLSSGGWKRTLLGRARRHPEHLPSHRYRDPLAGWSKADQIAEADGEVPQEEIIGRDAPG